LTDKGLLEKTFKKKSKGKTMRERGSSSVPGRIKRVVNNCKRGWRESAEKKKRAEEEGRRRREDHRSKEEPNQKLR